MYRDPSGMGGEPIFQKMEYTGNGWDYLKVVPNAATDLVNSTISLFGGAVELLDQTMFALATNGPIAALESTAAALNEVGNGMINTAESTWKYSTTTPLKQQLQESVSAEALEGGLSLVASMLLTKKAPMATASNIIKGASKMSLKDIEKVLGKNWHINGGKTKYINSFKKELKGSTNADFYLNSDTGDILLKGNKTESWVITGDNVKNY
jgi:hypothetical protein